MMKLRALIVEDSKNDATLAVRELEKAGYTVTHLVVQTADEMKKALERKSWDVVICDHSMPGFNSRDALLILQETGQDIPFIMLSGTMPEETAIDIMREGAQDFLIKKQIKRLGVIVARELAEAEKRKIKRNVEAKTRQRARDMALLNMLYSEINTGASLEMVLQILAEETKKIFDTVGATIYLLNEDGKSLVMTRRPGPFIDMIDLDKLKSLKIYTVKIHLGNAPVYRGIINSGTSVITNDPATIKRMMAEFTENKAIKKLVPAIYKAYPARSVLSVPLITDGKVIGLMDIARATPINKTEREWFTEIGKHMAAIVKRYQDEQTLFHMATHDPLTDVSNRRVLNEALQRAVALARRGKKSGITSVLIYLDVDNFKVVNDRLGHIKGDQVLADLAQRVQKSLRSEDVLARVGGDEFAVLVEGSSLRKGKATVDRINRAVADMSILIADGSIKLSFSSGLVLIDGRLDPESILAQADHIMYKNKNKNKKKRNKISGGSGLAS